MAARMQPREAGEAERQQRSFRIVGCLKQVCGQLALSLASFELTLLRALRQAPLRAGPAVEEVDGPGVGPVPRVPRNAGDASVVVGSRSSE